MKNEQKSIYFKWLDTPESQREPKSKRRFVKAYGVTMATLNAWDKAKAEFDNKTEYETLMGDLRDVLNGLKVAGEKGNAQAANTWLRYNFPEKFVEKSEQTIKHEISAGDRAKTINKADRELREMGYGMDSLPEELPVLPEELCKN